MATTTNYGWTTPDDTALVKDGAAAIRTLGSSVDSTLKTQIDAQIAKSIVTTKGDIIVATGSGTVVRQGVGTDGQVLIADSTQADGVTWGTPASGGSLTLLSTTTLSGTSTSISSISQAYTHLQVHIRSVVLSTGSDFCVGLNNNVIRSSGLQGGTSFNQSNGCLGSGGVTNYDSINFNVFYYTNTTNNKAISYSGQTNSSQPLGGNGYAPSTTGAVSIFNLSTTGGATLSGTVLIYGVK